MTRNGKIARLPTDIREELNRRLERNVPGITLVDWLNSLPEVHEVLRDLFDGIPIIPQNLSQWRRGGFLEWQARNDLFSRVRNADDTAEGLEKINGHIVERAAQLLSARFAVALAEWDTGPHSAPAGENHDPAAQSSPPASTPAIPPAVAALKFLLPLARVISQLRRGDREHARLKMEQYRFERFRRNKEEGDARSAQWARECAEAAAQAAAVSPPAPAPPPPVPNAGDTQSHSITPLSLSNDEPRPEELPREEPLLPAASSATSPVSPDPDLPLSEVEKSPAETHSTPVTTTEPPLSDWELRNRPLPSDPTPDWRVQLPIKTVLPSWLTPYSYKTSSSTRSRTSR